MAITIRNKETEAMIRRLAKRRNEGPSAVVRRLAENELQRDGEISRNEYMRRMLVFDELARRYPPLDPKVPWSEIEKEMDSIFGGLDEDGAPPQDKKSA
jgi:hypothetical protein